MSGQNIAVYSFFNFSDIFKMYLIEEWRNIMKQRLVIEKNNRTVIYGEPYEVKKSQTVAKFHKKTVQQAKELMKLLIDNHMALNPKYDHWYTQDMCNVVVYKDTINHKYNGDANLMLITLAIDDLKQFFSEKAIQQNDGRNFEEWLDTFTADDTEELYQFMVDHRKKFQLEDY